MRILVDEDLASHRLLTELKGLPGALEVLAPQRETSDDKVWERALAEEAALLTGNARDFVPRARQSPHHYGLLLVVRRNQPDDMTATDMARAVGEIARRYPDGVAGLTLVVNAFRRDSSVPDR